MKDKFITSMLILILTEATAFVGITSAHQDMLSPETGNRQTYEQMFKEMRRRFNVKYPEGLEESISQKGNAHAGSGIAVTHAGVMPHRGYRGRGTVNNELVKTLAQCIENGKLFKSCGGRLTEADVKPFMDWYETSKPGDDVEQFSRRIDIEKLAEPDIKIPAASGKNLHVVKLPAGKLGMVDNKPFYGHINFREGIIWLAAGTGKDRDDLDIEIDIIHETEEYNIAAQKAKKWGWTMDQMAQWRDGKSTKHGGFKAAREFFNLAHVRAAWRVLNKCYDELWSDQTVFSLPMIQKFKKARQGLKRAVSEHFGEEVALLPRFGLALISRGKEDEDFDTIASTIPDPRTSPLERLAEEAKIDQANEENVEEVDEFLTDYIVRARQMEKSNDPAQRVEGMRMLRSPVSIAHLLEELKAFIAHETKRKPEDIIFREKAFVQALCNIFSPAHIIDARTQKPYSTITVGDLLEEPREPRTSMEAVEKDEHLYQVLQLIKAYSDLLKGQGRGEIFGMLLSLMGLNITPSLTEEDVAQLIAKDYMPQPDIEVARAIVSAAIRRPFEYLPTETVSIDIEQIRTTEGIIETFRGDLRQGETEEETAQNINAVRVILLRVMYGKITDEEAVASLIWYLDNPTRPKAAELVEFARDTVTSIMAAPLGLSVKKPFHQLQKEVSQAI